MVHQQPTRLLLVRHAESVANAELRIQGWSDDPLSSRGEAQAQCLAYRLRDERVHADVLVASPLRRTYQTASTIGDALGLPVAVRNGLREIGLGSLENVHESQFMPAIEEADYEVKYGFETLSEFGERVLGTLYGLVAAYYGKTLLVVTHGGVIGIALAFWMERDFTRTWTGYGYAANASLTELVFGETMELVCFGDTCHLEA